MADNDITRDPHWESLHDEAVKLAREDAKAGRDPQVLTGHLAIMQDYYMEAYVESLASAAEN